MTSTLDLEAYFNRIRWGGAADPSFDVLAGLLRAHVSRIPFENFDVLMGRGVRLDIDSLQDKLVRAGRGGYCFEHATLFAAVLEKIGFRLTRHCARVILFVPANQAPRGHMFLVVTLPEGEFVVDPGFGPMRHAFPFRWQTAPRRAPNMKPIG
jgi:N-hydroxyarylamine O-acetyltransferase